MLLLYLGAEWLVKGAAGLGLSFGIRPLVIGLTVIAYGTSAPELVVSLVSAFKGMGDLALGNVAGSNLANLGLILGVTAIIAPVSVDGSLIRREAPVMFAASLVLPLCLLDGVVSRAEGVALLVVAIGFTFFALKGSGGLPPGAMVESDAEAAGAPSGEGVGRLAFIAAAGLSLLVVGGQVFVLGARGVALSLGLSERVVGLTVAAIGTSMPELAASVVAGLRGHSSMAVGNVIGSNIFNVFFVLGAVAVIRPVTGSFAAFRFDLVCLILLSAIGLILVRGARTLRRYEGVFLLAAYLVYLFLLTRGQ
jgi:cation:H+ antiporter